MSNDPKTVARLLQFILSTKHQRLSTPMNKKCEVVGWLLVDEAARVLVREESGQISRQAVTPENTFAHQAIQTGSFLLGAVIIDPVTKETLGYEMERLPTCLAALA